MNAMRTKRMLSLLLIVAMLVGLLPTVALAAPEAATAQTANAVTMAVENAGFEQADENGLPVGWANQNGKLEPKGSFARSTAQKNSGDASLQITATGNAIGVYSTGIFGVTEGYTYRATAMVNNASLSVAPQLKIVFFNMYTMECGSATATMTGSNGAWNEVVVEGVAPTGAVMARVMPYAPAANGNFFVDDVTFTELPLLADADTTAWTVDGDVRKSAPVNVIAGTEYVLTGLKADSAAVMSFYAAGGELLAQCAQDGDSIRAFAPAQATTMVISVAAAHSGTLTLLPNFAGTQATDGDFSSMTGNNTSGWTSYEPLSSDMYDFFGGDFEDEVAVETVPVETEPEVTEPEEEEVSYFASENWDIRGKATIEVSSEQAVSGTHSMKYVAPDTSWGNYAYSQKIDVKPGDTISVSAKYYLKSGNDSVESFNLIARCWGAGGTADSSAANLSTMGNQACTTANRDKWMDYSVSFTVPENRQYFTWMIYPGKCVIYFDDITITKNGEAIVSENFEPQQAEEEVSLLPLTPDAWDIKSTNITMSTSSEQAASGSNSMKWVNSTRTWASAYSQGFDVKPGDTITVNAKYYFVSGTGSVENFAIIVRAWGANGMEDTSASNFTQVNATYASNAAADRNVWKDYSYTFTVPANRELITLMIYSGQTIAYFDDITITKNGTVIASEGFEPEQTEEPEEDKMYFSPESWDPRSDINISLSNDYAASGTTALRYEVANANANTTWVYSYSELIPVEAGATYTISGKYFRESRSGYAGGGRFQIRYFDAAGTAGTLTGYQNGSDFNTWGQWTDFSITKTAPANTQYMTLFPYTGRVNLYLDDIVITKNGETVITEDFEPAASNDPVESYESIWDSIGNGSIFVSELDAYAGSNSLKFVATGDSWNSGVRSDAMSVIPGKTYIVNAKYKTDAAAGFDFMVEFYDSQDNRIGFEKCYWGPTNGYWSDLPDIYAIAPAGAVSMKLCVLSSTATVLFDDIYVTSPDFETNAADGWTVSNDVSEISYTSEQVYSGETALKYVGTSTGWSSAAKSSYILVEEADVANGAVYNLTGKYYGIGSGGFDVMLVFYDYSNNQIGLKNVWQRATNGWMDLAAVSGTFPAGTRRTQIYLASGAATVYLDDLSLTVGNAPAVYNGFETISGNGVASLKNSAALESNMIPVLPGKDYKAAVDVTGTATLTMTFYTSAGVPQGFKQITGTNTTLVVEGATSQWAHGIKLHLHADGNATFDNARIYAITDSVSNASFEDLTYKFAGNQLAIHWSSFGDVAARTMSTDNAADSAMATYLVGTGTEGGIRSSMIKVTAGKSYMVRAAITGNATTQIAYYDANLNRLGTGNTAPSGAAYACVEFIVTGNNTAVIDDVEFTEAVIDVADSVQLFIDDYIIAQTNMDRSFHQGEKAEMIFEPNQDILWERDGAYLYGTVLYDEEEQIYKMWYAAYNGSASEVSNDSKTVMTCYATSTDGITWERPNLGIVEYNGNTNNNIIGNHHIASVFIDYDAPADQRYTMITYLHDVHYYYLHSADGIHWSEPVSIISSGDVITAAYDKTNEQYFSIAKFAESGRREFFTMVGESIDNWNTPVMANSLANIVDAKEAWRADSYGMGLYEREGVYIGFNWEFYIPSTNAMEGVIETQLAFSRDLTEEWQRPTYEPMIPLGEDGAIDDGMIYTSSYPMEVGDELWLYTGVWSGDHGTRERDAYTYITKWRMDGFASMDAGSSEATLVTKPMTFTGNSLTINANANGGKLYAELLDANGNPIEGFTKADCNVISSDSVSQLVRWNGSADISALEGQVVTLKLYAENTEVYAFEFGQNDLSVPVEVAQVSGETYTSLQDAVDNANGNVVTLLTNCSGATVNADLTLDLNGSNVTDIVVSEGATLNLIDSATNDYEGEFGTAEVTGNVETYVEHDGKSYLVVCEDGKYSAHCYKVALTHVSLDPAHDALGYKAELFGDEIVGKYVSTFGFNLWVDGGNVVTRTKAFAGDSTYTLRLKNIFANKGAEMVINGNAFVTFSIDDKVVNTNDYSTTMKQTLQTVDANWDIYNQTQKDAVIALMQKYYDVAEQWDLDNIFPKIDIPIQ